MPGFAIKPEKSEGNISSTTYFIDKKTFYPIRMTGINFTKRKILNKKVFIDQRYYDILFNIRIDEEVEFNTTNEVLRGYKVEEMRP